MTKVTVYMRDNDKPGNREVVAFLRQHIQQLVRAGLQFTFTVADKMEKELIARGIDKLPAIEVHTSQGAKVFLTPVEIKSSMLKYLSAKSAASAGMRGPAKPEDDLNDYYAREMNMDKYEADLEDDEGGPAKKDIMSKVQQEVERRQAENDKRGPPKSKQRKRAANVSDDDDAPPVPVRRDADDQVPRSAPKRKVTTPQERIRAAGGDPGNPDDSMLLAMLETSDEV